MIDLTPFEIQLGSDLKEDIVKKALKKEESVDSADLLLLQSNDDNLKTEKDDIENKDNTSHSVGDTREAVAVVSVTN